MGQEQERSLCSASWDGAEMSPSLAPLALNGPNSRMKVAEMFLWTSVGDGFGGGASWKRGDICPVLGSVLHHGERVKRTRVRVAHASKFLGYISLKRSGLDQSEKV